LGTRAYSRVGDACGKAKSVISKLSRSMNVYSNYYN
jgi:hypothetical protein